MSLREEQKEARSKGIGASEAAAVLGLSPFKTAYQVWEDKTGLSTGLQEETPAMAYGKLMEGTIRQWYSNKTGQVVTVPEMGLAHPKYPFVLASPDGLVDAKRGLEIKTSRSSQGWGEPGTDEIPIYYTIQVQQQMLVFAFEVVDVVVSIGGSMPEIYEVPADSEIQEMIIEELAAFWKLVQDRIPPEPVSYADMIQRFGRKSSQTTIAVTSEIAMALQDLKVARQNIAVWEKQEEEYKTELMKYMAENETLADLDGNTLITWKMSKAAQRFDAKALQAADPATYNKYLKAGEPSRRFLLK